MLATLRKWIAWLLAWLRSFFRLEPIQGEPVMSALSIQPTYPIFTDIDGQPLEAGYVWIGTANLDPQTNPINVYWDAALTILAPQPIRTLAGYPSRNGTPARLYVNSDYSIRVMNKNGSAVYSAPTATERYSDVVVGGINAQDVAYDPPFAGAVQTNVEEALSRTVSPQDFGAAGDGVANDTAALQAMFATGLPWFIPYTANGYLFDDTLEPKASGECAGYLLADTGFADLAVNIEGLGYQPNTKITGLEVRCKSARTANSVGIRVASPSVVLDRCKVTAFDYGIQVWSYSVALMNCNANLCNTNLSAHAPSSTSEINDLKIIGGNFDSATQYSCRIGDPRFATTVPAGELMGFSVFVMGAAFDGATSTFDRVASLTIQSCYWEGPANGKAIELGGVGNNVIRTVDIRGCYFANVAYPIYCNNAIKDLTVGPNYYGVAGTQPICALYAVQIDVSPVNYYTGASSVGFLGPEVHTGYTDTTVGSLTFNGMTISNDYLIEGVQIAPTTSSTTSWYPNGKTLAGQTQLASASGRFKTNPSTGVAGTFSGTTFTCTTLADARNFNGGDRITSSTGGFTFVRFVDYVTGVITLGGGTSSSGSGTISQNSIYFRTVNVFASAAPTTGTYNQGDIVYNSAPTAGGTIGWVCTTAGTPGTWKTFGSIAP